MPCGRGAFDQPRRSLVCRRGFDIDGSVFVRRQAPLPVCQKQPGQSLHDRDPLPRSKQAPEANLDLATPNQRNLT